jgi:hypothetical protein
MDGDTDVGQVQKPRPHTQPALSHRERVLGEEPQGLADGLAIVRQQQRIEGVSGLTAGVRLKVGPAGGLHSSRPPDEHNRERCRLRVAGLCVASGGLDAPPRAVGQHPEGVVAWRNADVDTGDLASTTRPVLAPGRVRLPEALQRD